MQLTGTPTHDELTTCTGSWPRKHTHMTYMHMYMHMYMYMYAVQYAR